MSVSFKVADREGIEFTFKITKPLSWWCKVHDAIMFKEKSLEYPEYCELRDVICDAVDLSQKDYGQKE